MWLQTSFYIKTTYNSGESGEDPALGIAQQVDGTRTAIGAGAPVVSGWKGVAAAPKAMPVCALALFPGEDELLPLDGCQTIGESPATP